MSKRKRKAPKIPRVINQKTGKFMSRAEKEKQIMTDATKSSMPIAITEAEMEAEAVSEAMREAANVQDPPKVNPMDYLPKGNPVTEHMIEPLPAEVSQNGEDEPEEPLPTSYPPRTLPPEVRGEISLKEMEQATEIQPGQIVSDGLTANTLPEPQTIKFPSPPTPTIEQGTSTPTSPPQSETNDCSQELPEPVPQSQVDPQFTKLSEHVLTMVTEAYILAQLNSILANPAAMPRLGLWKPAVDLNVPRIIYSIINQPGYIGQVYPILKVLMGNSITNTQWTANVLITLAFNDMLKVLPMAQHLPGAKQ